MAEKGVVLWDTDILAELLGGNDDALSFYMQHQEDRHYYSAISYAEFMVGAKDKAQAQRIRKALLPYIQLDIDQTITEQFRVLIDSYSLSQGLAIPDAFIAATALAYDMELATCNEKHFRHIRGLRLAKHNVTPVKRSWWI